MIYDSEFLKKLNYYISQVIPEFDFSFQRMLIWNTILRNSRLNSLNYIHLYVEKFEDVLNSDNTRAKNYIKSIILKHKIKNLNNYFKIRFMLDGFNEPFLFDKKEFTKNELKKLQKDIENISEKLNYKIEIFDINTVGKDKIQKIDIFTKEIYLPIKF